MTYTCREPGHTQTFDTSKNRNRHEDREHPDSPHRVWRCRWAGCTAAKYDEPSLRGHMSRAHAMYAAQCDAMMPAITAERTRLLDAIRAEAEALKPTADDNLAPDVIYKQLRTLLEDWQTGQDNLAAAEDEIELLKDANAGLQRDWADALRELADARAELESERATLALYRDHFREISARCRDAVPG